MNLNGLISLSSFSPMERHQQALHSLEEWILRVKRYPCLWGIVIGCVCTSVLALSIGLIVHPYQLPKTNDIEVDGGWSKWKQFGSCSVTCGQGVIPIIRKCDQPAPSNNGEYCVGKSHSFGTCTRITCAETNIAMKKETRHSSLNLEHNLPSHFAVDGIVCQKDYRTCTHTNEEYQPWWVVDLGRVFNINMVVLYGRTDCCTDRLSNFDIDVFKPRANETLQLANFVQGVKTRCHYQPGNMPTHQKLKVHCGQGTIGQFVRVRLRNYNPLTLCEVEVYGNTTPKLFNDVDFFYGKSYVGPIVRSIENIKDEECSDICGTKSFQSGCMSSYLLHHNMCMIAETSKNKNGF